MSDKLIADVRPVPSAAAAASLPLARATGDFQRLRIRLYFAMMLGDAALIAGAFLLANLARFGRPFESYGLNSLAVLLPIYLAIGLNGGAWSFAALESSRRSVALASRALLMAIAVATIIFFSLKVGEDFSRLVFGVGAGLSLLSIAVARARVGEAVGRRHEWTFCSEVLIADGVSAWPSGRETVIDAEGEGLRPDTDDPEMLDRLGRLLGRCERAILACPPARRPAWSRMLAGANVDVEILAPELDRLGALALRRHGGQATLLIGCGPLGLRDRAIKRAFDLVVSAALLLAVSPLLLLVVLAIKLESPGPALFRQARMGRGNRLFSVLKFRTMSVEASDARGDRSTARDDQRITPVGRLLRRTSLDELPQLINVLKGEMSLVGPRPHALGSKAGDALFWTIDERYWNRHAIKPGMTGLAQVRGFRGATDRRADLTDRLQADLEYLAGWSLGRDVAILARTLRVMVHRNAY